MNDSILTLGIDARPAQSGSREFGRSIDDIKRKAGEGVAATDNIRGAFDRLKDNTSILRGTLGGLLGAFSATAIFSAFIRNTSQAQTSMAQLEAVISSTGGAAGVTVYQLEQMNQQMQRTTVYGDDMIRAAQTRLLSYTSIMGDTFPRAMQIVMDQSARLDMTLTQSAEIIGRALDAPSKAAEALSRQGFAASFTKEVQKTIKSLEEQGRIAEAQAVVMDMLEESYAGAAQAARNTLPGALDAAGNAFSDLFKISQESSDGIVKAINGFTDNIGLIPDAVELAGVAIGLYFTPALITSAAALATKIGLLVTYNALMARAAGAQAVLATAAGGLAAALPIAALGAMTYAIYEMIDGNDKAIEIERRFADELAKTSDMQYEYINASRTRRNEIRAHIKDNIASYQAEQKAYILMMQDYMKMSNIRLGFEELMGRARNEIFAPMGVVDYGITPGQVAAQLEGSLKNVKAMEEMLQQFDDIDSGKYNRTPRISGNDKTGRKKLTEEQKAYNKMLQEAAGIYDDTRTPLEKYNQQIERLDKLLGANLITQDTYSRAMKKYQEEMASAEKASREDLNRALDDINQSYSLIRPYEVAVDAAKKWREDTLKILRQSGGDYEKYAIQVEEIFQGRMREALDKSRDPFDGLTRGMEKYVEDATNGAANIERVFNTAATGTEDALVKAFTNASSAMESLRDVAQAVVNDIIRMYARQNITGPLFDALNGAMKGGSGGGGAGLFSQAFDWIASIFHDGGVVGESNAPKRSLPASTFRHAQRYHNGLAPDEFPAILQKGETVIPKGGAVAAEPQPIEVKVVNVVDQDTIRNMVAESMMNGRVKNVIVNSVLQETDRRGLQIRA